MIDDASRTQLDYLRSMARGEGRDLLEVLERNGWLRTPAAVNKDHRWVLGELLERFDALAPYQALEAGLPSYHAGKSATPAMMHGAVRRLLAVWIEDLVSES